MKKAIDNVTNIFRAYLKKQGLRYTPERETIIREIFSTHDHFDVDELYLRLRSRHGKISKASIYRLIPHLLACRLISEAYTEEGHRHYEHIYGQAHHDHLRCLACGKIIEFVNETIENAQKKVGKKYSFVIVDHTMEIVGYCKTCSARRNRAGDQEKNLEI